MTDEYNDFAFSLILALRGGELPLRCDFCGQEYTDTRWPVPEEGGEWACSECATRWAREQRE